MRWSADHGLLATDTLASLVDTDVALAMVGARKGLIGIVHERAIELQIHPENLTNFHCIIQQQNLCAKSIKFTNVMEVVVASINYIKSHALNHHQFKGYLADLFSDYEDVSYYCEVRWLSKGQMLKRCYDLRQGIADFYGHKRKQLTK
jgi:hypothetical protein